MGVGAAAAGGDGGAVFAAVGLAAVAQVAEVPAPDVARAGAAASVPSDEPVVPRHPRVLRRGAKGPRVEGEPPASPSAPAPSGLPSGAGGAPAPAAGTATPVVTGSVWSAPLATGTPGQGVGAAAAASPAAPVVPGAPSAGGEGAAAAAAIAAPAAAGGGLSELQGAWTEEFAAELAVLGGLASGSVGRVPSGLLSPEGRSEVPPVPEDAPQRVGPRAVQRRVLDSDDEEAGRPLRRPRVDEEESVLPEAPSAPGAGGRGRLGTYDCLFSPWSPAN